MKCQFAAPYAFNGYSIFENALLHTYRLSQSATLLASDDIFNVHMYIDNVIQYKNTILEFRVSKQTYTHAFAMKAFFSKACTGSPQIPCTTTVVFQ